MKATRSRALVVVPVAALATFLIARALAGGGSPGFYFAEVMLAKTLALYGCIAAVTRYQPGDRMRTIWLLFALDFVLLIGKDTVASPVVALGPRLLGPSLAAGLRTAFMLGANAAGTLAWIVLARTWRVAGVTLAGSPAMQRIVVTATIAVSIALVGWGTLSDVRLLLHGGDDAFVHIISDVADVIGFSLVAPVALFAYSLRGGSLFWPYLYLTACTFTWMLYDMTDALGVSLHLGPEQRHVIGEGFRCVACGLQFAAGLAQRWAVGNAGALAATAPKTAA